MYKLPELFFKGLPAFTQVIPLPAKPKDTRILSSAAHRA
jgi:hypothetical protein